MSARKFDRFLGIKTRGLKEWKGHHHYNRYEATPYQALEKLAQSYRFNTKGRLVDFGCGRGRVVFYLHNRFKIPIVGIEADDVVFGEALDNKQSYRLRAKEIPARIRFKFGLAEDYRIKKADTCFYFFNPFSERIFKKVAENIAESLGKSPRTADLILYYALPEYKKIIKKKTPFRLINKIRIPGAADPLEKFVVYRSRPVQAG
ncbi:MAG: SAM-dependent methyltransferase [Firmicutes bacterium]|nr:SAM-dependent methyltransferase [Bacillota bacterium]